MKKKQLSCFFSLQVFSLIFSSLPSSVLSLLLHLVSSFISVLSLLLHLVSSRLLFSFLFFSCLVLSCLSFSLFLCLSVSVSLSLSPCGGVWCLVYVLCRVVCVLCVVRVGVVWCLVCGVAPCVETKRPRVYRHHARMCQNMRAWCRYTQGRLESTHGGFFLDGHTGRGEGRKRRRVSPPVLLTMNGPRSYHLLERFTERNPCVLQISSLRTGREQHVSDSSNHSLSLLQLFSFSCPEEYCEGTTNTPPTHHHHHHSLSPLSPTPHNTPTRSQKQTQTPTQRHTRTHMYLYMYMYLYM